MLQYWQNNVAENFLPPISNQKRVEIEMRKVNNEPLKVKKEAVIRVKSASRLNHHSRQEHSHSQGSQQNLIEKEIPRHAIDEQYILMSDHPSMQ